MAEAAAEVGLAQLPAGEGRLRPGPWDGQGRAPRSCGGCTLVPVRPAADPLAGWAQRLRGGGGGPASSRSVRLQRDLLVPRGTRVAGAGAQEACGEGLAAGGRGRARGLVVSPVRGKQGAGRVVRGAGLQRVLFHRCFISCSCTYVFLSSAHFEKLN